MLLYRFMNFILAKLKKYKINTKIGPPNIL